MFKAVSLGIRSVDMLYFVLLSPFHCSLTSFSPTPLFQQLSVHTLISSTFTDVMFYDITDALSFSFPFPLSLSSMEQFYYYKMSYI
jgi:hypothetical protein